MLRTSFDDILVLIPRLYRSSALTMLMVEIIAGAAFVLLVAGFGFVVKTILGKSLLGKMDRFFSSIPLLNTIYRATRQVVDLVAVKKDNFFTRPVLVEYPVAGTWAVAFNTGEISDPAKDSRFCTVFIPTTPNPTSGYLAVISSDRIRPLNVSVEDAVKMILTGGMVKSDMLNESILKSFTEKFSAVKSFP